MRYGVIADIHSNLEAFEQVIPLLEHVDMIICLGDIVGYGPNPSECLELLKQTQNNTVVGNHDLGSVNKVSLQDFNFAAQEACEWTQSQLSENEKTYLHDLPLKAHVGKNILLVHGSPQNPTWEYLLSPRQAKTSFEKYDFQICFIGHTHIPAIFQKSPSGSCDIIRLEPNIPKQLSREMRYIINAGSIGQPRDGDPRASFAIFDEDAYTIEFLRALYPVEETQEKMKKANLSPYLIDRLGSGF